MIGQARTFFLFFFARGRPGVEVPPGVAAIAHLFAVLGASDTAFGRAPGASTYVRYADGHQKRKCKSEWLAHFVWVPSMNVTTHTHTVH